VDVAPGGSTPSRIRLRSAIAPTAPHRIAGARSYSELAPVDVWGDATPGPSRGATVHATGERLAAISFNSRDSTMLTPARGRARLFEGCTWLSEGHAWLSGTELGAAGVSFGLSREGPSTTEKEGEYGDFTLRIVVAALGGAL
jgi:hypothetical protein